MSNDISASMLVFPKYVRFLTSNMDIKERAAPAATFRSSFRSRPRRVWTHELPKVHLDELAVVFMLRARRAMPVLVCRVS